MCHIKSSKFMVLIAAVAFVAFLGVPESRADGTGGDAMDSLVTTEWLSRHLDDPDLVVLDATVLVKQDEAGNLISKNGRANYDAGHIPTAGFVDLMGDVSDPDSPLQFGMPSPERFAAAMGALGVGDDSRVVLYDATGSSWAARVWWMLRWVGGPPVAVLDGGLPRGQLSEIVGPASCGKTALLHALLATGTARGQVVALVDLDQAGKGGVTPLGEVEKRLERQQVLDID